MATRQRRNSFLVDETRLVRVASCESDIVRHVVAQTNVFWDFTVCDSN
jgi:hypothetical protein